MALSSLRLGVALLSIALPAAAQDWGNYGGNAQRNGRTPVVGPDAADLAWSNTDDFSIISWFPFIHEGRVFTIREAGFPQNGGAANDALVAYRLDDGAELWRTTLPFGGDTSTQWIAWIAGAYDGRVYASRSSNGKPGPIEAYDATTGAFLWASTWQGQAWAHDGVVFAEDGDLIVGDFQEIVRLEGTDGSTVWQTTRSCPVSGNCGVAISGGGIYFDEPAGGGNQIGKLDLATGAYLYSSPLMPGFTTQNSPFVGPDGTVYFARSQNNPATDFLYAFDDTGAQFVQRWAVPIRWTTGHEHGVADDGSVYTFNRDEELVRLDPLTGAETANAGVLAPLGTPNVTPHTVVDGDGKVYVTNGWASDPPSNGRLWAFDGDLTTNLFTLVLDRPNTGGPALGGNGTLVVADRTGVYGYRSPGLGTIYCTPANANSSGSPARLAASGSAVAADNDVTFAVVDLPPNQFGYFLMSATQDSIPVSAGVLCLGAPQFRFNEAVLNSGAAGAVSFQPDLADPPSGPPIQSGETWNFQLWFRDGAVSNFSDAVEIAFL